jgi:ankyrin repeat protein
VFDGRHLTAITLIGLLSAAVAAQSPNIDFGREVRPILQENCFGCHGPQQQMRGLRLDRRRDALPNRVGANGVTIVPGNSGGSRLFLRVSGTQAGLQMPPNGALRPEQINAIRLWIDQGAEWPDEFSGEATVPAPDPQAARLMTALRNGERAGQRLVRENLAGVNRRGMDGATPLIYAVLYGNAEDVRVLLEAGADPNLSNLAKATALMYAVDDLEKTRLLLKHGADPNTRSDENRTPLMIAAGRAGSAPIVSLLLEHGADPSVQVANGPGILARAAASGDPILLRLLLEKGVERKPLPLGVALRAGCPACIDGLLSIADRTDLNAGLENALRSGNLTAIRMLLDRAADVPANALALLAISATEPLPVNAVQGLIEKGASVNARTTYAGSILDHARRQGDPALLDLVVKAGATEAAAARAQPRPAPAGSVREALARSIPLLQHADVVFIQKSGCVSCHNNSLTAMAIAVARQNGLDVNGEIAKGQLRAIASYLDANRERALQGLGTPGGLDTAGYVLLGVAAEKYPPDAITDAWAVYLKNLQLADGRWPVQTTRPPLESSSIQTTAAALRVLQVYAPSSRRAEYAAAVRRAAQWLEKASPKTTEDRVFQILGLRWAEADSKPMQKMGRDLLALQRPDGGWSQLPWLASDAYATGQALVALKNAGTLATGGSAYQRAVQFLLKTQLSDGSWYVKTRTSPVQPYFDSEFPHGPDQFISAAATNWAVIALAPVASRANPH